MTQLYEKPLQALSGDVIPPSDEQFVDGGVAFAVYNLPEESAQSIMYTGKIAVHNTDGFNRLVGGSLDELQEGEAVIFGKKDYGVLGHDLCMVRREGDSFRFQSSREGVQSLGLGQLPETATDSPLTAGVKDIDSLFRFAGLGALDSGYVVDMVARTDELGHTYRDLGFSAHGGRIPLPRSLIDRLDRTSNATGRWLPEVRFIDANEIHEDQYVDAWADGMFPASSRLSWYGHDIMSDHFRALVVHGQEAMGLGQLYAQAVKGSESITARVYPDSYEVNKGDKAKKAEVTLSGEEKMKHAALCLDQFTSELDGLTSDLDNEPAPEDSIYPPEHMDFTAEMVAVIMESPEQRAQLLQHLDARGSKAVVDGKFDYKVYLTELLEMSRQRWGIEPRPYQASEPVTVSNNDPLIF